MTNPVIPAEAGIQTDFVPDGSAAGIPAFAGMTPGRAAE
jgi:hypothetical protein